MLKYIVLEFLFIFGALAWMIFGVGASPVYREQTPQPPSPHIYNIDSRPINKIQLYGFYFVPRNKEGKASADWSAVLEKVLQQTARFHHLQFSGLSNIKYKIYPTSIIGLHSQEIYDTEGTSGGNPRALINISLEIEKRIFNAEGDLFRADFEDNGAAAHRVMFIMYEGVGASGGIIHESEKENAEEIAAELGLSPETIFLVNLKSVDGFFIVNRELAEGMHGDFGESIVAHEFYHTIGVPDGYLEVASKEVPISQDIMGLGRWRPLDSTYLDRETLKKMGM